MNVLAFSMVLYLIIIAVLNTGLGFALAVYLVPPAALVGVCTKRPALPGLRRRKRLAEPTVEQAPADVVAVSDAMAVADEPPADVQPTDDPPTDDPPTDAQPADEQPVVADDIEPTIESEVAEPIDDDQQSPAELATLEDENDETSLSAKNCETVAQIPDDWLKILDEHGIEVASFVEATAQVLRLEISSYRDRLVQLDSRCRKAAGTIEPGTLQSQLDELREVNKTWLEAQVETADHLRSRTGALGRQRALAGRLLEILENQQVQIDTTIHKIASLDVEVDIVGSACQMLGELRSLLDLAHALRDRIFEVLLEIKKADNQLGDLDRTFTTDTLTGLDNRAGLEKALQEQFIADGVRTRQVSAALIDVDHFKKLMDAYGPVVADRILAALATVIDSLLRKERGFDLAARFDGQRIFTLMADTGPRGAMSAIERIRQTVVDTTFDHYGHSIEVTIRAGVAELGPSESAEELFGRLEAALAVATQNGRNCTILDEGNGPTKIDAPEYGVTGRTIPLT